MNREHPNITVLKKFDPANPDTIAEVMDPDFIWHYINPELPELEGDYQGLSGLTNFFKKLGSRTGDSFKVHPLAIVPLGDALVITHVKDTMINDGKRMQIDAVVLWCIKNGKLKEAWDIPVLHTAKFKNQ
ncbi:nuclear transport factor 2 family protein [Flavobacteriaceae bacterium M23B6Z8]